MRNKTILLALILVITMTTSCNKAVFFGKDRPIKPFTTTIDYPIAETFDASKKALLGLGYKIDSENPERGEIKTGWVPTKADSHYTLLFDMKDYATTGTYYRIEITVVKKGGSKSVIDIAALPKSLVPNTKSAYREEKKVIEKIKDILRKPDVRISNVGIEE